MLTRAKELLLRGLIPGIVLGILFATFMTALIVSHRVEDTRQTVGRIEDCLNQTDPTVCRLNVTVVVPTPVATATATPVVTPTSTPQFRPRVTPTPTPQTPAPVVE